MEIASKSEQRRIWKEDSVEEAAEDATFVEDRGLDAVGGANVDTSHCCNYSNYLRFPSLLPFVFPSCAYEMLPCS